jgi:disulfide oxidoreductase YuzD
MTEKQNELLEQEVKPENPLKEIFVNYVGEKLQPPNGEVTVDMIVKVLADEFPEFVVVMAEENFIQGYKQAFADMERVQEGGVLNDLGVKQVDLFENPTEE